MTLIVLPEDRVFRQGILHKDLFNIFLVSLVKNSTKIRKFTRLSRLSINQGVFGE